MNKVLLSNRSPTHDLKPSEDFNLRIFIKDFLLIVTGVCIISEIVIILITQVGKQKLF